MTVWRFLPYVLKNLWRHRARTVLTVSGSAVALFVFVFIGAVQDGLANLVQDPKSLHTLIVFQANRFCPSTSRLPEDYAGTIAKQPGVRDVVPIKVFTNNCRVSLDVVVFHGVPTGKLKSIRELRLISGDWNDFETRRDAAVVGRALAQRRGLNVGQRFSIGEVTVTVVGIYTAGRPSEENFLYTQLEFLQRTRGLNSVGTVTQFEVLLAEDANAEAAARAIDDRFRAGPIQTDTRTKGVFEANAVGDLVELVGLTRYLGLACLGMIFALLATTTVMAVQDRLREHAVLQTLGFTARQIFGLVTVESLLVSLLGGLVGVAGAIAALASGSLAVGTEGVIVAFTPSLAVAAMGMTAALALGLLASLLPAWQAARAEIVRSLRQI